MELTWIDDFLALKYARNFTRAAEARHTTQPAFSRRIQRLEEWLGAELFDRVNNPVTLTSAGVEFDARAVRLREDILDARRATQSIASHFDRTLRIFTTNTIAVSLLPKWLKKNQIKNYSLVVASISGCLEAVRQGRAHKALVARFAGDPVFEDFAADIVAKDKLILSAAPDVRKRVHLNDKQLTGPVMVYTPGTVYGAHIDRMLTKNRITFFAPPLCESASAEALLAQAEAGFGAAWLPQMLASKNLSRCSVPESFDIKYDVVLINSSVDKITDG